MRLLVAGTVSMLALTAPAQAADYMSPVTSGFDWSGFYAGVNAGAAFIEDRLDVVALGTTSDNGTEGSPTFGIQAGYNFLTDPLVLGLEADINFLHTENDLVFSGKPTGLFEVDHDWFATIRGRAGWLADGTLIYVTGGVAFLDTELALSGFGPATSDTEILSGFTVGGGIEHAFGNNWTGKFEYLYANFDSANISNVLSSASVDPTMNVVRIGVNRFF